MFSFRIGKCCIPNDGAPSVSLRLKMEAEKRISGRTGLECAHCKKKASQLADAGQKLSRCGKCRLAFYCGAACQRSDWPAHKAVCASIEYLHDLAEKTKARYPVDPATVPNEAWAAGPPRATKTKCDCTKTCEPDSCACRRNGWPCDMSVCGCAGEPYGRRGAQCGNGRGLSPCAATHYDRVASLTSNELSDSKRLPCCPAFKAFLHSGPAGPGAQMTVKELLKIQQCPRCGEEARAFYSFCLGKPVFSGICPGSVQHCDECGRCCDYMSSHCDTCNRCYYGNLLPCMWCHDVVLLHDGLHAIPRGKCNRYCHCESGLKPIKTF